MPRIWQIPDDFSSMHGSIPRVHFLIHYDAKTYEQSGSIITLAWNVSFILSFYQLPYHAILMNILIFLLRNKVIPFHPFSRRYNIFSAIINLNDSNEFIHPTCILLLHSSDFLNLQ